MSDQGQESLFRGVGKHALIYGVGMLLSRAVSFIMLPVYTRYLTPADYGVMALVEMTLDFIAIVGGAQLALGVFRFYHKADDEAARKEVVSTSLALVGFLYCAVAVAVIVIAEPLSRLLFGDETQTTIIRVAALNLAAGSMTIVPLTFARVRDLSMLLVGANLVKLLLGVGFNILFIVVLEVGVVGIFLASLIANGLVGGALVLWLGRRVGVRPSRQWTRNLLRYGIPLMGMQVATFVATFSDRYFLQAVGDETVVGLYSLAYQFGFLLTVVGFTPIDMVWGPKRFEVAGAPDGGEILARGFIVVNLVLITTAVGIALFVEDVLRVMATPAFHSAAGVVPVILVAYVLQSWASVQDIGILVKERTQYLTIANAAAAATAVVGYMILIPPFLEWGAAVATVLAFTVRYALTYRFSQRLWPVTYRWGSVLLLVGWATATAVAGILLPPLPILASVSMHVLLTAIYFVGLWYLPILRPDERDGAIRLARAGVHRLAAMKKSPTRSSV